MRQSRGQIATEQHLRLHEMHNDCVLTLQSDISWHNLIVKHIDSDYY